MAETLRVFVSASRDAEELRGIIGKVAARLPVRVSMEIRRTPREKATYEEIFERVANCDRVYVILGRDISAPMGTEWEIARELERPIVALRGNGPLSPAAHIFLAWTRARWLTFRTPEELAQWVMWDLIDLLLHPKNRYGLTPDEVHKLLLFRKQLAVQEVVQGEAGGTEGGGVLLDDIRREPLEGQLLQPPEEETGESSTGD